MRQNLSNVLYKDFLYKIMARRVVSATAFRRINILN